MAIARDFGSARVRLRRWVARDLPHFAALNADPEVMRFFPACLDRVASDAFAARIEAHLHAHGWGLWAAEARAEGAFMGFVGLQEVRFVPPWLAQQPAERDPQRGPSGPSPAGMLRDPLDHSDRSSGPSQAASPALPASGGPLGAPPVEIGWRLARRFWGRGLAHEAAQVVLDFAFNELKLRDVVSFTTIHNMRSRGLMERLGMRRDPAEDFVHPSLPSDHPLAPHVLYRVQRTSA